MIKRRDNRLSMFYSLADMLDQSHPLYLLADKIDWTRFEEAFTPLYSEGMGAPAKDIRLMCGLLILKHVRNLSDGRLWSSGRRTPTSSISVEWTRFHLASLALRRSWCTSAIASARAVWS